jgi:hypothetical protein
VRIALATAFLWFSIAKLGSLSENSAVAETQTLLHVYLPNFWAKIALIIVEAFLGIWLLSGWKRRTSLTCGIVLLSVFSGILVNEIAQKNPRACGCASVVAIHEASQIKRSLEVGLFRNLTLMVFGSTAICLDAAKRNATLVATFES